MVSTYGLLSGTEFFVNVIARFGLSRKAEVIRKVLERMRNLETKEENKKARKKRTIRMRAKRAEVVGKKMCEIEEYTQPCHLWKRGDGRGRA